MLKVVEEFQPRNKNSSNYLVQDFRYRRRLILHVIMDAIIQELLSKSFSCTVALFDF